MKRLFALFIPFLLALLIGTVACGGGVPVQAGGPPPGWQAKDMRTPVPTDDPRVYGPEDYNRDQSATAVAGATKAAAYAATVSAVQTLLPPATPTLAPKRPDPYIIQPGDNLGLIMQKVTGCGIQEVAAFNHLPNISTIIAGNTLLWPAHCLAAE